MLPLPHGDGASMLGTNELLRLSTLLPYLPCGFCSVPQLIDSNATSIINSLMPFCALWTGLSGHKPTWREQRWPDLSLSNSLPFASHGGLTSGPWFSGTTVAVLPCLKGSSFSPCFGELLHSQWWRERRHAHLLSSEVRQDLLMTAITLRNTLNATCLSTNKANQDT